MRTAPKFKTFGHFWPAKPHHLTDPPSTMSKKPTAQKRSSESKQPAAKHAASRDAVSKMLDAHIRTSIQELKDDAAERIAQLKPVDVARKEIMTELDNEIAGTHRVFERNEERIAKLKKWNAEVGDGIMQQLRKLAASTGLSDWCFSLTEPITAHTTIFTSCSREDAISCGKIIAARIATEITPRYPVYAKVKAYDDHGTDDDDRIMISLSMFSPGLWPTPGSAAASH